MHSFNWMMIQATVAILILVGFESVTSMGGEAKNAKRDIPLAVIFSLLIQGLVCYLFEYFAANYFLNSGYTMQSAAGSAAPIGDMMIIVGDALFGQGHGKYFMLAEAVTVFLALIGTTLACMNTGARVTYAMGKDDEAPEHFGMLHSKTLTPHRAVRTLSFITAVIGVISISLLFGDASAPTDATIAALPHGIFSSVGYLSHDTLAALPNSLLMITLVSNFGTFILYALSCILCMVAYHKRPDHSFLKHTLIPVFGVLANVGCMAFYLIGPFLGYRHSEGAAAGADHRSSLGRLWRVLLPEVVQGQGQDCTAGIQSSVGIAQSGKTDTLCLAGQSPGNSPSISCWRGGSLRLPGHVPPGTTTAKLVRAVNPHVGCGLWTGNRLGQSAAA